MSGHGVAIVGCGAMGNVHCAALAKMGNPRLVAAVDVDIERARTFQRNYGFERVGTDYRAELVRDDFDIVLLCTHWARRRDIIKDCFDAGKHVLAEKPLSIYLEECDEIFQMANARRLKLRVGMMERFRPMFLELVEIIGRDTIGKPQVYSFMHHQRGGMSAVDAGWQYHRKLLAGGVTPNMDCGIHKCDLVRWFSGADAERVVSAGQKLEPDAPANNFCHSVFWMKDGSTLTLEDCFSRNTECFIHMWMMGDKGRILFEYAGSHDRPIRGSEEDIIHIWRRCEARNETIHTPCSIKPVGPQMEQFMREIDEDLDMDWHYENVRKATEMVVGTALSEHRDAPVRFPLTQADLAEARRIITR
mgnify:CR=1 FL=1